MSLIQICRLLARIMRNDISVSTIKVPHPSTWNTVTSLDIGKLTKQNVKDIGDMFEPKVYL